MSAGKGVREARDDAIQQLRVEPQNDLSEEPQRKHGQRQSMSEGIGVGALRKRTGILMLFQSRG